MCQQALVLLSQGLLTQGLLYEAPVAIKYLILLCHLRINTLLSLVLSQELLQLVGIETAGLLVDKWGLCQHGIGSLLQNVLQLGICYREAQLGGLSLYNLGLHIGIPHHVLDLIKLLLMQILSTLLHLNHLRILVDELLEVLHINLLT